MTTVDGLPEDPPRTRRVKVIERFQGPRVHHRTGLWPRLRSIVMLVLLAALLGAAVAGGLAALVAGIAYLIHQATSA